MQERCSYYSESKHESCALPRFHEERHFDLKSWLKNHNHSDSAEKSGPFDKKSYLKSSGRAAKGNPTITIRQHKDWWLVEINGALIDRFDTNDEAKAFAAGKRVTR